MTPAAAPQSTPRLLATFTQPLPYTLDKPHFFLIFIGPKYNLGPKFGCQSLTDWGRFETALIWLAKILWENQSFFWLQEVLAFKINYYPDPCMTSIHAVRSSVKHYQNCSPKIGLGLGGLKGCRLTKPLVPPKVGNLPEEKAQTYHHQMISNSVCIVENLHFPIRIFSHW